MVPMSTFKATFPDGKEAHQPSCPTCSNEGAYAMTALHAPMRPCPPRAAATCPALPVLPGAGIPTVRNDARASIFMTLTDVRKDNLRAAARPSGGSVKHEESAI